MLKSKFRDYTYFVLFGCTTEVVSMQLSIIQILSMSACKLYY